MIERAVALSSAAIIGADELPDVKSSKLLGDVAPTFPPEGVDLDRLTSEYERTWVLRALEQTGGVRTRAAMLLGISFRSLRYRLDKLGLDKGDESDE